jgi:hypothetical protein
MLDARDPDPSRLAEWFYMVLDGFRLVQKPGGNLASLSGLRKGLSAPSCFPSAGIYEFLTLLFISFLSYISLSF